MTTPIGVPARALAIALGLAVALVPAASGMAASKKPAKHGTVKGCSLKKKAKCKKARITKAKVGKVNLTGTDLSGATITGATFSGTNLTGVNLKGARISNSTFTNVKVGNLTLDGARLSNVTFTGVTTGVARQAAREQDCSAVDNASADDSTQVFTCTGGGLSLRNAVLGHDIRFIDSVIPSSDFSGAKSASGLQQETAFGFATVSLVGTDAHASNFTGMTAPVGTSAAPKSPQRATNVSGSLFNNAWIWAMSNTNASNASFLGAEWVFMTSSQLASFGVDTVGARGLSGATGVGVNVGGGLAPASLAGVNIREDGTYWRPGIHCLAGVVPCTNNSVAIGAPVVVSALASTPIEFAPPPAPWSCSRVAGSGAYPYGATCVLGAATPGNTALTLQPYTAPVVTRQVKVVSSDPWNTPARTLSSIRIDVVDAAGAVLSTTSCYDAADCEKTVTDGSWVRVTTTSPAGAWMDVTCAPGDTIQLIAPQTPFACPDAKIAADRTTEVTLS